ncbi:MAG: hypothetical protein UY48_C0005G0016 [Candidatus Gottesmanbacteria bacterium GW2011_GWB1_49_7]|uniref:Uncharacterized protein n=1 Tax=Candidatus Gottesmanbacteria bacterium GW2011_GWB1_49_7 TaxID=1618448 RepID=A0A0G1W3A0_9BACT|nr:MAG: hypothetical protein UY48_C0005G0016 [Candidatus Gottesmanbacteria bacterium GW2011_GWB1_49_7]
MKPKYTYTVQVRDPLLEWIHVGVPLQEVSLDRALGALDLAACLYPGVRYRILQSDGKVVDEAGGQGPATAVQVQLIGRARKGK